MSMKIKVVIEDEGAERGRSHELGDGAAGKRIPRVAHTLSPPPRRAMLAAGIIAQEWGCRNPSSLPEAG